MRRACAAALLLCAALAHAHGYKRAEMAASPFVLSSRYGRSSPRMSPRNDRFFLTGRYGKRSGAGRLELVADRDSLRENLAGERDSLRAGLASDRDSLRADLASDRDSLRADVASDRDTHRWRPRCSCQRYAAARARAGYYESAPELAHASRGGR